MKVEVYYTGGGITIAEAEVDPKTVAVVTSEAPEFLSLYKKDHEGYLPENMLASKPMDELDEKLKALHAEMVDKLNG